MRSAAALVACAAVACRPAVADDPTYEIRVATEATIALGATGALSVTIAPSGNRTVSTAGPVRIAVAAPAGLGLPRRRYARKDAADPAADAPRFDIKLKAKDAGDHPVALELRFWLCGPRVCRPITTTRTVTVHVAPPAPPADAAAPLDAALPVDAGVPVDAGRPRRR